MKKKVIRLTESELYRIITSSAKKYIKEAMEYQPSEEVEWDYESIGSWNDEIFIESVDGLYTAAFQLDEMDNVSLIYVLDRDNDIEVDNPNIIENANTIAKSYVEDYLQDSMESSMLDTEKYFGSEGEYWRWKQGR